MVNLHEHHPLLVYYRLLDDGEFDACASLFAENARYIRPASLTADSLVAIRGRPAILAYFQARGKLPHRHRILRAACDGGSCFVEGRGGGNEGGPFASLHAFMAHCNINEEGLIDRYLAIVSMPDADGEIGENN